jgi:hypothetical protein
VITDVAFGEPFGDLKTDTDVHEYIETSEAILPVLMLLTVFPWLTRVMEIPLIGKMSLPSDGDNVGLGKAMG